MDNFILNFNVGVLGHIDSGKTSLSKALSTVSSTAAFDKNPQSQERGITIDLGFSSFSIDVPKHIEEKNSSYKVLQFTLVDCPGHASLIRTIIGGSQIIDLIMLVIDVTKGMQTQTAECLILGEITCEHMIVVLNKIDLVQLESRDTVIEKIKKKVLKTLDRTKFKNSAIIAVSANPIDANPIGIQNLIESLKMHAYLPERSSQGPFMFAVDHCFGIKGQGTVMTGTVLQGSIQIGDSIEIPSEKIVRKVKSIQIFKKPVSKAVQGDRIGICVTQFDPKILERATVSSPGCLEAVDMAIVTVEKIPYFKGKCTTNSKFHISILHDTVIAKCTFFCSELFSNNTEFNQSDNYVYLDEIPESTEEGKSKYKIYTLLRFEKAVRLNNHSTYIASKLETDIHANQCRLAFHGKVLSVTANKNSSEFLSNLKIYKEKIKKGFVERIVNEQQIIVRDLFKKETNIKIFTNLKIHLSSGEEGIIEGTFGQSGKINVRIPNGLLTDTITKLKNKKDKREKDKEDVIIVTLKFKKYLHDDQKKIYQT